MIHFKLNSKHQHDREILLLRYSFRQLEAFFWVARLGSFRAAAQRLNLTQPTITLRVQEFERQLDSTLFDRSGYRARLTHQGVQVFQHAERILSLAEEMEEFNRRRDPLRGLLRIGAADSFALTCLPHLLRTLEEQYPDLRVEMSIAFSHSLIQQLVNREIDIAFLTNVPAANDITAEPLGNIDLAWVASPRLRLPERNLGPRDLANTRIITNPPPSYLYNSIQRWFASDGLEPPRISTCTSLTIIIRLVTSGSGVGVLPVSILTSEFETGLLRLLRAKPDIPPHLMHVAYPTDEAAPGINAVIRAARDILARTPLLSPL